MMNQWGILEEGIIEKEELYVITSCMHISFMRWSQIDRQELLFNKKLIHLCYLIMFRSSSLLKHTDLIFTYMWANCKGKWETNEPKQNLPCIWICLKVKSSTATRWSMNLAANAARCIHVCLKFLDKISPPKISQEDCCSDELRIHLTLLIKIKIKILCDSYMTWRGLLC